MMYTGWLYLNKKPLLRKGVVLLLFLLGVCKTSFAQWNWIRSGDGAVENYGLSVCNDGSGNTYITGTYEAPVLTFGNYSLAKAGSSDIFLVKYDSDGNVLWAKREGGTNFEQGYSVTTDKQRNVYVGGRFGSNPIIFGTYTLTNNGDNDFFLVKYDPDGNVIWAISGGGNQADPLFTVKTDSENNVYVTGYTTSTPLVIGTYTMTGNPYGIYIIKYDKNGNLLWAKGSVGNAVSYALTLDSQNNIFITGGFDGPLVIGNYTVTSDINAGGHFLIKLDSDGNVIWGKHSNAGYGYSLSANENGDVFVTGTYNTTTAIIGSFTITNYTPTTGVSDVFLAKYDKNGNVGWAKSIGGTGDDYGQCVTTDASGLYITGSYTSSITIGSYTLPGSAYEPMYFARMDFEGNVNFATSLKSGGGIIQNWVCTDNLGNAYITGNFKTSPFYAGIYFVNQTGDRNVYLAKYHFADVGIDEHQTENSKFSISPNPNNGNFKIHLKDRHVVQDVEISIFDITGKELLKQKKEIAGSCELNLENLLDNGIYLVKINLEDGTHDVHRLVIEK